MPILIPTDIDKKLLLSDLPSTQLTKTVPGGWMDGKVGWVGGWKMSFKENSKSEIWT